MQAATIKFLLPTGERCGERTDVFDGKSVL